MITSQLKAIIYHCSVCGKTQEFPYDGVSKINSTLLFPSFPETEENKYDSDGNYHVEFFTCGACVKEKCSDDEFNVSNEIQQLILSTAKNKALCRTTFDNVISVCNERFDKLLSEYNPRKDDKDLYDEIFEKSKKSNKIEKIINQKFSGLRDNYCQRLFNKLKTDDFLEVISECTKEYQKLEAACLAFTQKSPTSECKLITRKDIENVYNLDYKHTEDCHIVFRDTIDDNKFYAVEDMSRNEVLDFSEYANFDLEGVLKVCANSLVDIYMKHVREKFLVAIKEIRNKK